MKAIFMGTPEFAIPSFEALYESDFEIALVVTQPDRPKGRGKKLSSPPVKLVALEHNIEVFQPERIKDREAIEKIKQVKPDLIIVVAFGQILPKEILELPRYGCINVHASLLPKYRGAAPINFAIINGEKKTGVTTMYMEEGLDTGDMLLKNEVEITPEDTASTLHDKLAIAGKKTLADTLKAIINTELVPEKQDDSISSYAPIMTKELGKINWDRSAEAISNLVRGTDPWPSAYTLYDSAVLKLFAPVVLDKQSKEKPGTIIAVSSEGIDIASADYIVRIKEIQISGKKRMPVGEFLKGNVLEIGKVLGYE